MFHARIMLTTRFHHHKITTLQGCTWLRQNFEHARSAGPQWILGPLNPQEINFLARFALHGIFTKIMIFHENLKFHHQVSDLDAARTFSQKFSGSSRVENLKRHVKISDWTKRN